MDGIRSIGEMEVLKKVPDFCALGIDASVEVRHERCVKRGGPNDNVSLDEFVELDGRDRGLSDGSGTLEVDECLRRVDYSVFNDKGIKDFFGSIHDFYRAILQNRRPNLDEYFMKKAFISATRSTCLRRSVGAVLAKDKRIISSGYNGAPRGVEHCLDRGCLREGIVSGERHELCRGAHAEQNAIDQIAFHGGTSTKDATLYVTNFPCNLCVKSIINVAVKRMVYHSSYSDDLTEELVKESHLIAEKYTGAEPDSYERFFPASVHP